MSSNFVRVETDFLEAACTEVAVQSCSITQPPEHLGELGAASETSGSTVKEVAALPGTSQQGAGDGDLWAFKRRRQSADMVAGREGGLTQDQLSWFSGGKARTLKVIGSPY